MMLPVMGRSRVVGVWIHRQTVHFMRRNTYLFASTYHNVSDASIARLQRALHTGPRRLQQWEARKYS